MQVTADGNRQYEAPVPVVSTLRLTRHRALEEPDMDITPMIDITFLLLIFFTVATKIATQTDVDLPPAEYGVNVVERDSIVLTVATGPGGTVEIYPGKGKQSEQRFDATDPAAQEELVRDYIASALQQPHVRPQVVLLVDRLVKHRVVSALARTVAEAGDAALYVAVLEEAN